MRKFSINQKELSYEKLHKKIREINDTIEESFSVQYLDQDGDKVTVRSTEELTNALNDQVNLYLQMRFSQQITKMRAQAHTKKFEELTA